MTGLLYQQTPSTRSFPTSPTHKLPISLYVSSTMQPVQLQIQGCKHRLLWQVCPVVFLSYTVASVALAVGSDDSVECGTLHMQGGHASMGMMQFDIGNSGCVLAHCFPFMLSPVALCSCMCLLAERGPVATAWTHMAEELLQQHAHQCCFVCWSVSNQRASADNVRRKLRACRLTLPLEKRKRLRHLGMMIRASVPRSSRRHKMQLLH